jgi:hypothetical protein
MGCYESKPSCCLIAEKPFASVMRRKKKNQNIMIWLSGREVGRSTNTRIFMDIYIEKISLLFSNKSIYENGITYQECIDLFRENVAVNSETYELLLSHFNWLYFELEHDCLLMECHVSDFIGHMHLIGVYEKLNRKAKYTQSGT